MGTKFTEISALEDGSRAEVYMGSNYLTQSTL